MDRFAYLLISSLCTIGISGYDVSVQNTIIEGPGLDAEVVVPVRYFFIQVVDSTGENFTDSVGEKAFTIDMSEKDSGRRIRVWVQLLDRHDGSYIVRYKLYAAVINLKIEVRYMGEHVAKSPYLLSGRVYQEKCYCPEQDFDKWLDTLNCPKSYTQIKKDLSPFSKLDFRKVEKEAVERFNQRGRHSLCHYVIKDNKIYRKTYGEHVGFKMFMDAMLLSLARKVVLPDTEFFLNLGDWPLEKKKLKDNPIPVISWCGSRNTRDIVLPTYKITESTLETMGRVTLDLMSVQANTGPKWENKSSMAFWRGRDSRQERLDLVKMSRKNPEILDAKLTNMFFFKKDPEQYGELVKHISFFDFFKWKYQVNIDGTVAAYRLPYLMAGDSLVLKQDSDYYEHFYKDLKPFEHYVPYKHDLSDLFQQVEWAKQHEDESKKIAKNAQDYIRNNLMPTDVYCYHGILFREFMKKVASPVVIGEDMELVPQPDDGDSICDCKRGDKNKDEL